MSDEEPENPRAEYEDYVQKIADYLNGENAQPRIWLTPAIYHRREAAPESSFVEIVPLTKLRSLCKQANIERMSKSTSTAFKRVHNDDSVIFVDTFIKDLAKFDCTDSPPEDKKHLLFS